MMTTDTSKHQHFIYYLILTKSLFFQYELSEGAKNNKNTKISFVELTDHQSVTFDNADVIELDPTNIVDETIIMTIQDIEKNIEEQKLA